VTEADGRGPTYYDRPVIKEPVWIWAVPAYFFAGGAAGAAAALGATAQILGGKELRGLVVRCRRLAAAGAAAGTCLLIYDLGRPERFLNMLRVFRPTSPMSVGSWVLAAGTTLTSGAAMLSETRLVRIAEAAGLASGVVGVPLTGYTAVLLSDTAVPVWQSVGRSLPVLFVASGTASAASLLSLADLNDAEEKVVRRLDLVASVAELVAAWAVERDASRVRRVGRPLKEGLSGSLWKASTALAVGSLVLSIVPGKSRTKSVGSALLGIAGGVALRFALFHAGKASARDPHATFDMQGSEGA
jgi:formate-dependent nitrite reductase membrane component NrfD